MLAKDPVLLAFDTATEQMAAALHVPGLSAPGLASPAGSLKFCRPGGAAASANLLPQLQALLTQAGLRWQDLQALAFGQGPGAFTGLRTSCAVAQGLGLGLGLPLLAIDSLLIVAQDAHTQWLAKHPVHEAMDLEAGFEVGVLMDARMDEIYAGRYRWPTAAEVHGNTGARSWQVLDAPALYPLPLLLDAWRGLPLQAVAGSALAVFGPRLALPQAQARFENETDRAAALLRLALQAHHQGLAVDAADALPLYLREKVAQTTEERARLAAAKLAAERPAAAGMAPSAAAAANRARA